MPSLFRRSSGSPLYPR